MTVRFLQGRNVASCSLSDSPSSEDSEEVVLAAKERGTVELRAGGLRVAGRRGWAPAVDTAGGAPSVDESLRIRT